MRKAIVDARESLYLLSIELVILYLAAFGLLALKTDNLFSAGMAYSAVLCTFVLAYLLPAVALLFAAAGAHGIRRAAMAGARGAAVFQVAAFLLMVVLVMSLWASPSVCFYETDKSAMCHVKGDAVDLPFMQRALQIPAENVTQWVLKTSDILEQLRLRDNATCKLDYLCGLNGVAIKTSSGLEAIHMAADGRWDELELYCANDVNILCDLYRKRILKHPTRSDVVVDLSEYVPPGFYV